MVEKEYDSMICLGPKCYSGIKGDKKVIDSVAKTNFVCVTKGKGVDMKKNSITSNDYLNVLDNMTTVKGVHTGFQLKNGQMIQIEMNKNALTCAHTKMFCFPNHICAPIIKNVSYQF